MLPVCYSRHLALIRVVSTGVVSSGNVGTCPSHSNHLIVQLRKLRERLCKMSDAELIQFGKTVGNLSGPRVNPTPDPWKVQLEEARADWRRRHPNTEVCRSRKAAFILGSDRQEVAGETNTARRKKSPRRPTWPLGLSESNKVAALTAGRNPHSNSVSQCVF